MLTTKNHKRGRLDIDGGVQTDIYQSMAAGVECAAAFIPFLTKQYEQSDSCALELKFAVQRGVPIVPVMLQQGFSPGGWLGLLTAGVLYVEMYVSSKLDESIDNLILQVELSIMPQQAAGTQQINEMLRLLRLAHTRQCPQRVRGSHNLPPGLNAALLGEGGPCDWFQQRLLGGKRGTRCLMGVLITVAAAIVAVAVTLWVIIWMTSGLEPRSRYEPRPRHEVTANCSDPASPSFSLDSNKSAADNSNCSYVCEELGSFFGIAVQIPGHLCYIKPTHWPIAAVLVRAGEAAVIQGHAMGAGDRNRTALNWRVDAVGKSACVVLRHIMMTGLVAVVQKTAPIHASNPGGAVFVNGGTLVVEYSLFVGNSADSVGGAIAKFDSTGTTRIVGCTFDRNKAGEGGAIHLWNPGASVMIADTIFSKNEAVGPAALGGGVGGAVNTVGITDTLVIDQCRFSGNSASIGGAVATGYGGPCNANTVLKNCSFVENVVRQSGGTGGHGGAVWIDTGSPFRSAVFSDCRGSGNGGTALYWYGALPQDAQCTAHETAAVCELDRKLSVDVNGQWAYVSLSMPSKDPCPLSTMPAFTNAGTCVGSEIPNPGNCDVSCEMGLGPGSRAAATCEIVPTELEGIALGSLAGVCACPNGTRLSPHNVSGPRCV